MPQLSSATATSSTGSSAALTQPRLHGIRLGFARVAWTIVVVLLLAFFLANLPVYVAQLQTVCLHSPCAPWQLAPASARTLQHLHLSLDGYALVSLVISVASVCIWCAVAALIFWRQSQQGIALLMSLLLVVQGIIQMSGPFQTPLEYTAPGWQRATVLLETLNMSLIIVVFSLFPTGRFVPRWLRWLVALLTAGLWIYVIATAASVPWETVVTPLTFGIWLCGIGSIIGAQIYRYRRVSTWAERQQTKWVVLGMIGGVLVGVLYFLPPQVFPTLGQTGSLYGLLARPGYNLLFLFAPISIGIALLRYRLWDIDHLINQALVYGSLTVLLGTCYYGLIIGLESLANAITGQAARSGVLVVSTLVIAALFWPMRRRIQAVIDRHFYRQKYDASKTLAAFGATLQRVVDLEESRRQLLTVVQETMQPTHVSLWLRPTHPQDLQETWQSIDARTGPTSQRSPSSSSAVDFDDCQISAERDDP